MRKLLLLLSAFQLTFTILHAQNTPSCHKTDAVVEFAMLSNDDEFIRSHKAPRNYIYDGKGEMITFKTPDGTDGRGFFIKSSKPTDNFIFVFQEWWGLNDNIKNYSQKLFDDLGNVNILAIDLYDGRVASNPDSARQLMQSFNGERGTALVRGALDFAGKKAKVGTIGWCFGGTWSLQSSLILEKQAAGCVIYYGMPEKDVNVLKKLQPEVLGIFASRDKFITPAVVKEFENNTKAAGKQITVKIYDADHGFANPSNSIFDKAATEDAWKRTIAFFRKKLV